MAFNLEDYEPVASRIARFWQEHPLGAIHTELVFDDGHRCVVKATVYFDSTAQPVSSDYAEEIQTERGVNSTSRIENCSTSAQGRALAAAGFLPSDWTKKPSREEMTKVFTSNGQQREQFKQGNVTISRPAGLASDKQKNMIRAICKSQGMTPPNNLDSMDKAQASAFIDKLKAGEGNAMADQEDYNLAAEEPF